MIGNWETGRRGDWETRRLGDGVIGREVGDESFLQFSIHFIFVNLWLYKNKTLEVTESGTKVLKLYESQQKI